ncbi:helix-turn-helix domain-containing protein [Micromonospora sp. DT31]|uniref:helix-turn-helix domain-containing protein n=1 Tax=Micromonospora sp. DT31 TaxID=3393434 RepID=UPI003CEF40B7
MDQGTMTATAPSRQRATVDRSRRHSKPNAHRRSRTQCQPRRGVKFLRWPHEEGKRSDYLAERIPILWVVESAYAPPQKLDPIEDWVRLPMPQADVDARVTCLMHRALNEAVPVIGPDNVLHTRAGRLALADSEAAILAPLAENFQCVVARKALVERGWGQPSDQYRNALDLRILRLRRRIAPLGLEIKTVWGRGYMLELA